MPYRASDGYGREYDGQPENKNNKVLESFAAYCKAHPTERFWQALRNWSAYNFILVADSIKFDGDSVEVKYPDLGSFFNTRPLKDVGIAGDYSYSMIGD